RFAGGLGIHGQERIIKSGRGGGSTGAPAEREDMKNLFVGNLPHSTTEDELRRLFEAHGTVDRVSVVTDRDTGRSRGFAFVEMSNAGEADKAVAALNGSDL